VSYRPIDIDRTPCIIGSRRFNGERVLVCASACGVSGVLAGHFTRGLPPCGSCAFVIAFVNAVNTAWQARAPTSRQSVYM
jgi:hypothetical protein